MNESADNRSVVEGVLRTWREEFAKLNSSQQDAVSGTLADLREPCQVAVVWLRNSKLNIDRHLWVITRFNDEPDMDIVVGGPVETQDIKDKVKAVLDIPRFRRSLPEPKYFFEIATYAELVESQVLQLIAGIRGDILQTAWVGEIERRSVPMMQQRISDQGFTWNFNISPDQIDVDNLIATMIQDLMSRAESVENAQRADKPATPTTGKDEASPLRNGFGSYLYPHVWIGQKPVVSFDERVRLAMFNPQTHVNRLLDQSLALFKELGDFYVVAKQDGFIGVTIEDRETALRTLNVFMSVMTVAGVPALSVKENELQSISVETVRQAIVRTQGPITLPRMLPSSRQPEFEINLREPLSVEKLEELWDNTAKILEDQRISDLVLLFGEVYTQYQNEEYAACIVFASKWVEKWSMVAGPVFNQGEDLHSDMTRTPQSIFEAIGWLEKISEIDPGMTVRLSELRNIRNSVLHEFNPALRSDAEAALSVVADLLRNLKV